MNIGSLITSQINLHQLRDFEPGSSLYPSCLNLSSTSFVVRPCFKLLYSFILSPLTKKNLTISNNVFSQGKLVRVGK